MKYRIKELRESIHMSQEELAQKSKVSRSIISSLENGSDKNTTIKTLLQISQAMGTSIKSIFL